MPYLLNAASTPELSFNYDSVLNEVLRIRESTIIAIKTLHNLGKILKFQIDITTLDGAPCAEGGFVDQMDIPPIDTWFYVTQNYLYCWIPKMFIPKMQEAIDVECMGSYNWLEESDPELNQNACNTLQKNGG